MEESVVNEMQFQEKLILAFEEQSGARAMWNRARLESVKKILQDAVNSTAFYNYSKTYELLKVGGECHVILKRKNKSDHFIYVIPTEDYYSKLLEAHLNTGHGGRDKMLYYFKKKYRIARLACEIFLTCCQTCDRKRSVQKKNVVVKLIISNGFNTRAQVDLIDFQSCPDGEYKWLLNYQDHATKFLHLRPLTTKHAANVAEELSKIFYTFGAPSILQSDNGREFVAEIIEKLVSLWPHCKIIHGRPRHPQSQGSVERANADVKNMLKAWMIDNKSNNWSRGCYEVQWQKNSSKHRVINRTPYEAVFGEIKFNLHSIGIPENALKNITSEDDLEASLSQLGQSQENNYSQCEEQSVSQCVEILSSATTVLSVNENNQSQQDFCTFCEEVLDEINIIHCNTCDIKMHDKCGELDLLTEAHIICPLCARGSNLRNIQNDCFEKQKKQASKMVTFSEENFPPLNIGDCISLSVPNVDRGPLDFNNILGIVTDIHNGVYKIGTKSGLINGWFPRSDIQKSGSEIISLNDVPNDIQISLREAASFQSISGGQGIKKCNCKPAKNQCKTSRCSCFKAKIKCGSRCHKSVNCCNK